MKFKFELCVTSPQGCQVAEECRLDRIELCSALSEGGLTPSAGLLHYACSQSVYSAVNVLIRPRAGDFIYSTSEVRVMRDDILRAKDEGAHGVVLGCLNPEGWLDVKAMEVLLKAAEGMKVTFHRAIDVCADRMAMLEVLITLGVDHVLTSGGKGSAIDGVAELAALQQQAKGRITLIAGAGVGADNIAQIAQISGVREFHFSAKDTVPSQMQFRNPDVFMGLPGSNEYALQITSLSKVIATVRALCESQVK